MTLYIVGSPNCRKVIATKNYLNLDCEVVKLNPFEGDLKKHCSLAIDPSSTIPALRDGNFELWESNAIMIYMASYRSHPTFFPEDIVKRADILRWLFWELAYFNQTVDSAGLSVKFYRYLQHLNKQFEGKLFITGEYLTLADFALGSMVVYAQQQGAVFKDYPNIQTWYERLERIPAWAQSE